MTPRKQAENQRIRDERKEKIIEAASKVFARKGLASAKIADIAAAADMSHGLVYHYFASKDEVFATLVYRAMDGAIMATQGANAQPGSPWERLQWMVSIMLSGVQYQPEYFMVVIEALSSDAVPKDVRETAWKKSLVSQEGVVALIQEGQAAGEVAQGDPQELASVFMAIIQGLAITRPLGQALGLPLPRPETVLRILKP